jgi:uncharacterized membrane protein
MWRLDGEKRTLWVPIIDLCWSGGMLVLVEGSAEPVRLRTSRRASRSGSVIGSGSGRRGAASARVRRGRCWLQECSYSRSGAGGGVGAENLIRRTRPGGVR